MKLKGLLRRSRPSTLFKIMLCLSFRGASAGSDAFFATDAFLYYFEVRDFSLFRNRTGIGLRPLDFLRLGSLVDSLNAPEEFEEKTFFDCP